MMEIERLKSLKEEETHEVRKHKARKKGVQVIVDQIQERTVQRMKEQEIRDKETLGLLSNIEKAHQAKQAALRSK